MAVTKDWSTTSGVGTAADGPTSCGYFAGGDGSSWCVHTPPKWAKRATVINYGATPLYVSKPALSGSAGGASTANAVRLENHPSGAGYTGSSWTVILVAESGKSGISPSGELARTFSTFGGDGATHPMRIIFDHGYGGA